MRGLLSIAASKELLKPSTALITFDFPFEAADQSGHFGSGRADPSFTPAVSDRGSSHGAG